MAAMQWWYGDRPRGRCPQVSPALLMVPSCEGSRVVHIVQAATDTWRGRPADVLTWRFSALRSRPWALPGERSPPSCWRSRVGAIAAMLAWIPSRAPRPCVRSSCPLRGLWPPHCSRRRHARRSRRGSARSFLPAFAAYCVGQPKPHLLVTPVPAASVSPAAPPAPPESSSGCAAHALVALAVLDAPR